MTAKLPSSQIRELGSAANYLICLWLGAYESFGSFFSPSDSRMRMRACAHARITIKLPILPSSQASLFKADKYGLS
jgi:hypothetical protein